MCRLGNQQQLNYVLLRYNITRQGRRFPMLRHKGFTFSYEPLEHKEVVQRLSKKPFYNPEGRIVPKHYKKRN